MYLSRDSTDVSRSTSTATTDDSCSTITNLSSNTTPPKEPVVTQRVTRSSQRNAQQNGDSNEQKAGNGNVDNEGEDNNSAVHTERCDQSGRKAKRKKLEQQADSEQDGQQQAQPPTVVPEFCPANYRVPESNSIELYRGIVKARHKDMMRFNSVPLKAPCGINDYLLMNGPYLLEGDMLGVGLSGQSIKRSSLADISSPCSHQQLPRLKMKFSRTETGSFRLLSSAQHQLAANRRLNTYIVPQLLQAPESLRVKSPLYELFQLQEKARHKMRMQHLKERERSILTSEQEVLRAYNQDENLSACIYFHHQERYHYLDEKEGKSEILDYPPNASSRDKLAPMTDSSRSNEDEDKGTTTVCASDGGGGTPEPKVIEKLISDLQELDDKWAQIKQEMFKRHKNESDTLHAIQELEWEWRAKETGACDKEYVPRVEVSPLEY